MAVGQKAQKPCRNVLSPIFVSTSVSVLEEKEEMAKHCNCKYFFKEQPPQYYASFTIVF